MVTTVRVDIRFEQDRSMAVFVHGVDGPVLSGVTRSSSELSKLAHDGAVAIYGPVGIDVDLRIDRPFWLKEGDIVRISDDFLDFDSEPMRNPYAQVVGFLPVGGVIAVQPRVGAGIFPPEKLAVVEKSSLDPLLISQLSVAAVGNNASNSPAEGSRDALSQDSEDGKSGASRLRGESLDVRADE